MTRYTGLTTAEVRDRVERGLSNDFQARVGRSYWDIVRDNLLNLFNIVLFTLLLVVLAFGDYATVVFAGVSVVSNTVLGMIQEISAKRKLDQLAALSATEANVWRDGVLVSLPLERLVVDDVIALEPGDRIVVDGDVIHSDSLEIDESQLTGEADPVPKRAGDPVQSGSFCLAGTGVMVARRVGRDSTINQLSVIAKVYKRVLTPTQQKIVAFVQLSVLVMVIALPMIFVAGFLNDLALLEIFRNAVVFVTSLVPQGLVLTAILALTLGALSISRFETLIQRVNAVESLANVTVLCFDKTGTLTENHLEVQELRPLNGIAPDAIRRLLLTYTANVGHLNHTTAAIAAYAARSPNGRQPDVREKTHEIPFTSLRKWGAVVLEDETLVLGAPERIFAGDENESMLATAHELSTAGLRVIALARTRERITTDELNVPREPLALIVLSDRVREDIQTTLDSFHRQHVKLKVISGDNLETVSAIARQAGMQDIVAYHGDDLRAMADSELENAVVAGNLFARVDPDTKRRIIAALREQGEYVAMVGDGVNDVPALKEANLAIVMNDGAQISKDVADIVLLNNAMSTLPRAFTEGRTITQTIFGTSKLFLVKNFYSLLFFFFVSFMALPFPISPVQISWITFGVINIPATLIAFRVLRPTYMRRFRQDVLDYVVTGGIISAAAGAFVYAAAYLDGFNQDVARSAVTIYYALFGMQVVWNTHGVEVLRPDTIRQNWRIFLLGLILLTLTITIPFVLPSFWPEAAAIFEFVPPTPLIWLEIGAVFALTVLLLEIAMRRRALVGQLWRLSEP